MQRQRLPKYKRDPERFGRFELQPRDLQILRLVLDYRFVNADHVLALVPGSKRQIARRLQGLFHHAHLKRLLPPLQVREAGRDWQGSPKVAYAADLAGVQAICRADGCTVDDIGWSPRQSRRMAWFLEHRLMISTFRATLEQALASRDDLALEEWIDEEELRASVTVRYPSGGEHEYRVAPDAYARVNQRGEQLSLLLEADRGTEEHARLLTKFTSLWWYLSEGSPFFEQYPNAKNRRVLIVTTSQARLDRMRATLRRVDSRGRGLRQFWFTTEAAFRMAEPATLLSEVWFVGPKPAVGVPDPRRSLFGPADD